MPSPLREPPPDPFSQMHDLQQRSDDIAIYAPMIDELVAIAWPMESGKAVPPFALVGWLNARGLHWPCFCSKKGDTSEPMRIVITSDGNVWGVCQSLKPECSSILNFSALYETATRHSEYPNLPKTNSGQLPSTAALLDFYLREMEYALLPFFRGYAGEHEFDHSGRTQCLYLAVPAAPADAKEVNAETPKSDEEGLDEEGSDEPEELWWASDGGARAVTRIVKNPNS
ncbi:hypothetical protein CVT26_005963 [Gymnopilus dilepis]|uniref:Uncharacterized protein n=1 Tax=Gymnopilus dilepis TaxID=231916 RepID=A0A409Y1L8_9AGAR|nr:hypothetical protein CVT26_005963 [Gymnopilus dilepis]